MEMSTMVSILQDYGAWGVVTVQMFAIWRLVRYIAQIHQQRQGDAIKVMDEQRQETKEMVTAIVEVRNTLGSVREAIDRFNSRLERLED